MIRVALVEDETIVQDTVTFLLETSDDLVLVGRFNEVQAALKSLPQLRPDVVLVDIGLPDGSGLELIRSLREVLPRTEFLVLTVFDDDRHILEAILAGASGYLVKRDLPELLLKAIRTVRQGASWMSAGIARRVLELFREELAPANALRTLTSREQEILQLLSEGFSNAEIAERLKISAETVRTHIRHIYRKLQVHNRTEAAARFLRYGRHTPNG
ncbi:LuxR C-terminal-related transcriptional regulator [Rhodothermus marinus]|uniref:LuxR C-terminal-related transcriptional regulator n=2 Tax=Rhodothermus marinus TaxID=29549 RepID=UPI0012BA43D8|nr:response regulator transcription factor [Rhodothermus marinus]BBM69203.1 DNA-binding response regulator [Rhodothermus marinus]BBM72195.1 DNA-binding response regulator [Rhodothermus marinus]